MSKRVFVTGGSSGIGSAVVKALTEQGYSVCFTFNRHREQAENLCRQIEEQGGTAQALPCDLSDPEVVQGLSERLENDPLGFYGFVHCAGVKYDALVATMEMAKARQLMQVNFFAFVSLYRALLPQMMVRREGRVVAVSSIAARQGCQGNAMYGASKSALEGFMHSAIHEVGRRGVTINVVEPGYIETPMTEAYQNVQAQICQSIPCRRFGRSEEVAHAIGFLFSEPATYINGETLVIDGGLSKNSRGF